MGVTNIMNDLGISASSVQLMQAGMALKKENTLATGTRTENETAAELKLSGKKGYGADTDIEEIIRENILSMESSITDTAAAEEMIANANRAILSNSGESLLAQSSQSAGVASRLLF